MNKRIVIVTLLFITSLYVVHNLSDRRGFERGAANKASEVAQSYQRGFKASEDSVQPLVSHAHRQGVEQGKIEKESEVAACTVAMAHEGRCLLPCESHFDCVAKNGHPKREY